MKIICHTNYAEKSDCYHSAQWYETGAKSSGMLTYQVMQENHCECIDTDEILDHYESFFVTFYKRYSGLTKKKVIKTVHNAVDEWEITNDVIEQLQHLHYKVHKKFGKSIAHTSQRAALVEAGVGKRPNIKGRTKDFGSWHKEL